MNSLIYDYILHIDFVKQRMFPICEAEKSRKYSPIMLMLAFREKL